VLTSITDESVQQESNQFSSKKKLYVRYLTYEIVGCVS